MQAATADRQIQKFALVDGSRIRDYYREQGYVVVRSLMTHSKIDAFLEQYERVKSRRTFVYYSQSIHRAVRPALNEHGFITQSMQDATRLGLAPRFSRAIKACIYDRAISEALTVIDGHAKHVSWQDMFFDLSTGTIEHADSWYLDTDPGGALVGAWIALEDIQPDAGPFFVMPGSHRARALSKDDFSDHEQFRLATLEQIKAHGYTPKAMPLAKGDVLFWHPSTIHGGFANVDPRYSRKSFTSHYFPLGMRRQSEVGQAELEPTANPDLLRLRLTGDRMNHLRLLRRFVRDARAGWAPVEDMRRQSYQ